MSSGDSGRGWTATRSRDQGRAHPQARWIAQHLASWPFLGRASVRPVGVGENLVVFFCVDLNLILFARPWPDLPRPGKAHCVEHVGRFGLTLPLLRRLRVVPLASAPFDGCVGMKKNRCCAAFEGDLGGLAWGTPSAEGSWIPAGALRHAALGSSPFAFWA